MSLLGWCIIRWMGVCIHAYSSVRSAMIANTTGSLVLLLVLSSCVRADEVRLETDSVSKNYESELPRIAPTEPQDSLSKFKIAEGFRIELAAHEPVVADPIAMSFDEHGRLYVVCMNGYSEDADDNLGVVRVLEDKDRDGTFESGSDFLTGLSWPTAVACYDGGIFLAVAPDILYCKDTDGDGRADEKRVVFTGFARNNVQGMLNSFRWGLDNRLYGASGLNGGKITSPESKNVVNLRGRDFSIDPATMTMRPESGGAQHGATFDRWGERFVCSNSDHLQWVEYDDRHLVRNPLLRGYRARRSIAVDGPAAEVYRTSAVEPWRLVRTRLRVKGMVGGPVEGGGRASGYFTSASGLTAYSGDGLDIDRENSGKYSDENRDYFFVGDVGSNLVHLKRVATQGLEKLAERATLANTEFLTSTDNWFRPVQFANAPDGTLYLVDMYREVIEHPLSLPPMIKKHLDLTSGRDRGRIYRIRSSAGDPKRRQLPGDASDEELVAMLGHANGWHRETAARVLVSRCSKSRKAVAKFTPLLLMASKASSPHARIRAIYCLRSIGAYSEPTLIRGLEDDHPLVRIHALKILENTRHIGEATVSQLQRLVHDEDERVRYQLALTLGGVPPDVRREPLSELMGRLPVDARSNKMRFAVLSSMGDDRIEMLRLLTSGFEDADVKVLDEVARQIGQSKQDVDQALELFQQLPEPQRLRLSCSLLDGTGKRGIALTDWLAQKRIVDAGELLRGLLESAQRRSVDSSLDLEQRLLAARQLRLGDYSEVDETIRALLATSQDAAIQNVAVEVLGTFPELAAAEQLIEVVSRLDPIGRRRAFDLLVGRASWARKLLQSVADGETPKQQISAIYRDKLLRHRTPDIAKPAKSLLGGQSDRMSVVAKYQSVVERSGDPIRGHALFRKVCSSCHRLEGVGANVGPDLQPLRNRGASYLLMNILDPNREVDPRYESYTVVTDGGRSISGLLRHEGASLELTQADGTVVVVSKSEIDQLQATGRSLMPEGLERDLGEEGVADVIAWLVRPAISGEKNN